MKKFQYFMFAILALPLFGACSDDDSKSPGNPLITVQESNLTSAQFGDSLQFDVNCKDEGGIPLSTLKAYLYFGDELVSQTTIRTKTEGDYEGKIYVPFLKDIPNGTATLKFALQNIHFTITEKTLDLPVTRPENDYLNLVTSDGTVYKMSPVDGQPYLYKTTVSSSTNIVKGYIVAPAVGESGNELTFGLGDDGVVQGVTNNISFVSQHIGDIDITFNTQTYEYTPVFDPNAPAVEVNITPSDNTFVGDFIQGQKYKFTGDDAMNADSWFYDTDYFTKNDDGTFTFNAVTGQYTIYADFSNQYFRIWAMDGTNPASLNSDGTGALWIIGSEGINKPTWAAINHGWWTGTDSDLCLAQIRSKVYQVTLTIGQQLDPNNINFKFFGQAGWGTEFHAKGSDHNLSLTSTDFMMGDGDNGGDNGNIYIMPGVTLNEGDTYVFTVDLTGGCANGVLTITKK